MKRHLSLVYKDRETFQELLIRDKSVSVHHKKLNAWYRSQQVFITKN